MPQNDHGYINFFRLLDLPEDCKPGEVRKTYRKLMKDLLLEISRLRLTPELRDQYLLKIATLNAAYYVLRDNAMREHYMQAREQVIAREAAWREAVEQQQPEPEIERARRQYDTAVRDFLSRYMEENMLVAGRDPECVEASNWDAAHERHASRVLRHYRQRLYHEIHERLPFSEVTRPEIDWAEREKAVLAVLE